MKLVPAGSTFAQVDDEDYEFLSKFVWTVTTWRTCTYAKRKNIDGDTISMHSLVLDIDPDSDEEIDHIDGDGLNNQKSNLRIVTHAKNIQNQRIQKRSKSGYRGVSYFPNAGEWRRKKPWRARIKVEGVDVTLGYYSTPEEAAKRWNKAALVAWGEHANLNIIPEEKEVGQQ